MFPVDHFLELCHVNELFSNIEVPIACLLDTPQRFLGCLFG